MSSTCLWVLSSPSWKNLHYWPGIGLEEVSCLVIFAAGVYALWKIKAPEEWTSSSVLLVVSVLFDSTLWLNPRVLFNAFPLLLALGVWLRRDWYRTTTCSSPASCQWSSCST